MCVTYNNYKLEEGRMYASKIPKHELELECILWDTPALWRMVVVGEGRVITDDLGRP